MPYAYFFGLHPAVTLVDDIRSHYSPHAGQVSVIYLALHIYTVGINVQMENATLGISM